MDIEMIIPEEVNNTNILSEEALNPQDALSDELSQNDDVKRNELHKKLLEPLEKALQATLLGRVDNLLLGHELSQDDIIKQSGKCFFHEHLKEAQQATPAGLMKNWLLGSDKLSTHDDFKKCLELQKIWIEEVVGIDFKKEQEATPGRVNNLWEYDEKFFPAEKALGFREFLSSIPQSVFHIHGHYHCALLFLSPSIVHYRAQVLTTEFASKLGTQSPLSMREAFTMFLPQIIDIMTIMLCYVLILWLVCPLPPVLQMFILLMLIAAPFYYIPQLMGMASRTDVTCGFFNLPHIWFTILGALVLSLISVSLSLLVMYLIKRFIHPGPGGPTVKQSKVSLDAISDAADMA